MNKVNVLRQAHRESWMAERKIQGWEVLDLRYGGLLARLETLGARIDRYLSGSLSCLEEFEEKDIKIYRDLKHYPANYKNVAQVPFSRW